MNPFFRSLILLVGVAFLSLTCAQAQKGCMQQMMSSLSSMHAVVFIPENQADSLLSRAQSRGKSNIRFYEGEEAAWANDLLSQHLGEVVAIRPNISSGNPCANKWSRTINKQHFLILVPSEFVEAAGHKGFETVSHEELQSLAGGDNEWRGLLNELLNTLSNKNPLDLKVNVQAITGKNKPSGGSPWYMERAPAGYESSGEESFQLGGQLYRRLKLR